MNAQPPNIALQRTPAASPPSPLSFGTLGRSVIRLVGIAAALGTIAAGCKLSPKKVSLDSSQVAPILKAIAEVNRESLGFTPIAATTAAELEIGPRNGYDAMLHLHDSTNRTIAFRKTADGYRWISEQEIHYGPGIRKTEDGDEQECIVVEYQTDRVNGIPLNTTVGQYDGEDPRLAGRRQLSLADVKPVLEEWKGTPIR